VSTNGSFGHYRSPFKKYVEKKIRRTVNCRIYFKKVKKPDGQEISVRSNKLKAYNLTKELDQEAYY
jgi:hypothetical protein